jgi:hypothetical protein
MSYCITGTAIFVDFEFIETEPFHSWGVMLFSCYDACVLAGVPCDASSTLESWTVRTEPEAGLWELMLRSSSHGKIAGSLASQVPVAIVRT